MWMNSFRLFFALLALICTHATATLADAASLTQAGLNEANLNKAGFSEIEFHSASRNTRITSSLWYPVTDSLAVAVEIKANKVFEGVMAVPDAAIAEAKHAVIVLAHGGMRSAPNMSSWLASALAKRGYVVVIPHPPVLKASDATLAPAELWLRPADLSQVLDVLLSHPLTADFIDINRVYGLGFLLGGHSVLMLAGAQIDHAAYAQSCLEESASLDCQWFAQSGVDLRDWAIPLTLPNRREQRIKAVIAIDPELSDVFTQQSLREIDQPVLLINLGRDVARYPWLLADRLATQIPQATYEVISDAGPFSAFSLCTERGVEILQASADQADLCLDGGLRARHEIHQQLIDRVFGFLDAQLP